MSNDIVVILLKGTHTLNSTIHIENHKNLTIIGESGYTLSLTCDQPVSWINCTSSEAGILFLNSRNILVMNLGLNSCGSIHSGTLDSDAGKLVNFNVSAALSFGLSYNVSIIRVIINDTYGYGLNMDCVFGNIWINESFLVRASKAGDGKLGGNARFWFGQSSHCAHKCSTKYANLVIFRSTFM